MVLLIVYPNWVREVKQIKFNNLIKPHSESSFLFEQNECGGSGFPLAENEKFIFQYFIFHSISMDIILNITCQVNAFYSLESQKVTVHKSITVSNHQSVTDLYQAYIIIYIPRQV